VQIDDQVITFAFDLRMDLRFQGRLGGVEQHRRRVLSRGMEGCLSPCPRRLLLS
jgi:hypothetical protein